MPRSGLVLPAFPDGLALNASDIEPQLFPAAAQRESDVRCGREVHVKHSPEPTLRKALRALRLRKPRPPGIELITVPILNTPARAKHALADPRETFFPETQNQNRSNNVFPWRASSAIPANRTAVSNRWRTQEGLRLSFAGINPLPPISELGRRLGDRLQTPVDAIACRFERHL